MIKALIETYPIRNLLPDLPSPYRYTSNLGGPSDSEILNSNHEVISKLTGDCFSWTHNTTSHPVSFEERKINLVILSKIFERDGYETFITKDNYDELKPYLSIQE